MYTYIINANNAEYKERLRDLLQKYDNDFVPPLSARGSTMESNLQKEPNESHSINKYLRSVMSQFNLLAFEGDRLIGLMSCIVDEDINEYYVSTVLVEKEYRNKGITTQFYKLLMSLNENIIISTRTWSTNIEHTNILHDFGFFLSKRIENDRGEGIDTVYYEKHLKKGI